VSYLFSRYALVVQLPTRLYLFGTLFQTAQNLKIVSWNEGGDMDKLTRKLYRGLTMVTVEIGLLDNYDDATSSWFLFV
jgi:hypothetical protein